MCRADRSSETKPITVLTYNVLADGKDAKVRLPVLLDLLGRSNADILAFQEATSWFVERMLMQKWSRKGYHHTPLKRGQPEGGLFILSRFPIQSAEVIPLPSKQRRKVLIARLRIQDVTVAVATVHLDSYLEFGSTRAKQLDMVFARLKKDRHAILLGDFNFGDGQQPETGRLRGRFKDAWKALRPKDPGFTWNIEKSPMARTGSFPNEPSRRLDRILVCSDRWKAEAVKIIGDAPVSSKIPVLFPSDHFGLLARLGVRN